MRRGTSTRSRGNEGAGGGGGSETPRAFQEAAGLLRIFEKCWRDPAFKASFVEKPSVVLEAEGIQIPPGVDIVVVENDPRVIHIVLPSQSTEAPAAPEIDALVPGPLRRRCEVAGWT